MFAQVHPYEVAPLVSRHSQLDDDDEGFISYDKKSIYSWKEVGFTECTETCLGGTNLNFLLGKLSEY